ncbi:MAG: phage tail protein [Sphingobacteriia bacterium]|nr:phage tail protein [Sphingobacteriia bacterium]
MDCFVGEIRLFAGNYATPGWAVCDGSLLQISQYQALFALLGTTYGGDGVTNFRLPNLIGKVPVGTGTSTAANGSTYTVGMTGGATSVTITDANMPTHTHNFNAATDAADTGDPRGAYYAQGNGTSYPDVEFYCNLPTGINKPNITLAANVLNNSGGGLPHENMMPYTGMLYIIATNGVFPTFS